MKQQQRKKFREATATEYPRAPFPMCFTEAALEHLLATVGTEPPETGAKGFGPQAVIGFDVVEFDEAGSAMKSFTSRIQSGVRGGKRII